MLYKQIYGIEDASFFEIKTPLQRNKGELLFNILIN